MTKNTHKYDDIDNDDPMDFPREEIELRRGHVRPPTLYDVLAVSIELGTVRLIGENKDSANAEAAVNLAVMRRGVKEEFFTVAFAGKYRDGERWQG